MNVKKIFALAKEKGIDELELYISKNKKLSISIFHKKVESYNVAENEVLSARGIYQGKMGCAYTERLDQQTAEFIVNSIINNAQIIEENKEVSLFKGSLKYKKMKTYNDSFTKESVKEKIARLLKAEEVALNYDPRIVEVAGLPYEEEENKISIINSQGLNLSQKTVDAMCYCETLAKENDDSKTGFKYQIIANYDEFDPEKVAIESAKEAISQLLAEPVKSKKYKILLDASVMASMISSLKRSLFGENINKNKSKLVDKLNQKIASSKVTLIEEPHSKKYPFYYRSFDDEGVATSTKKIIDKGVLKTYLYNLESAKEANVETTGNGYKNSPLGVVATNTALLVLKPGKKTKEELMQKMKSGLYITGIQGIHAGMDGLSGNFSLQANGYVIEEGKIVKPVNLITIAGNLFTLFETIQDVANDSMITYSGVECPSVFVKSLVVSGK